MVTKLHKLIAILGCIFLLSSCSANDVDTIQMAANIITVVTIAGDASYNTKNERSASSTMTITYDDTLWATYIKTFSNKLSSAKISHIDSFDDIEKNVNTNETVCPQINLSTNITSSFSLYFKQPLSEKEIEVRDLQEQQPTDNYIPIIVYDKAMPRFYRDIGFYQLVDALNYQWCKGYDDFIKRESKTKHNNITNNTDIIYNVNLAISTKMVSCNKTFGEAHCLVLNYKYDIDVINNKTKTSYFKQNLAYSENTSDTVGDVAYNPLNYYIAPIVQKNRYVIEYDLFTDDLYKKFTLNSTNQTNSTSTKQ